MEKSTICPSLLYYRFSENNKGITNCVSILDFEKDMMSLLDEGYISVSIETIIEHKKNNVPLPQKSFCLIFQGGYEDNYSIAFPIIQRLKIHTSIFVDPDIVGVSYCSNEPEFIPRFNWEQAREMISSGFVSIYAFWHPSENDHDILSDEIERRVGLIESHLVNVSAIKSFYINISQFEKERITALKDVGIESFIIAFWLMNSEKISSGAIPFTCVNPGSNVFDLIEEFNQKCENMLKQEEDTFKTTVYIDKWDNSDYKTVELHVDKKPLVRNFLRHAFPLSILGASRKDKVEMLVLYDYIDVIFRPWYHLFDYDNALYDSWSTLTCSKMPREILKANRLNILDCIINGLNSGYYCDLWVDVFYIPGKFGFNKNHFTHNLLVYGYDKERDLFKTLTYSEGQYVELEVESLNIARSCSTDYFNTANFIKINKESPIVYLKSELLKRLKNYMHSQYNYSLSGKYNSYDVNQFCNRLACEHFPEYVTATARKDKCVFPVALYGFLEHKKCMGWRLKYMIQKEGIEDDIINDFEKKAEQLCELGRNLGIKFNLTNNEHTLLKLNDVLLSLNEQEKIALSRLFELLENNS